MANKALIVVDVQNDFMEGGSLAVAGANAAFLDDVNHFVRKFDGLVVASQDWHPFDHGSFASVSGVPLFSLFNLNGNQQVAWPDHCVQGSKGADFAAVDSYTTEKQGVIHHRLYQQNTRAIFRKGMDNKVDSYSAFADNNGLNPTGLEGFLRFHNVQEVVVIGLAFDYCVKFTAIDAAKLGFKTSIVEKLCRSVAPSSRATDVLELAEAKVELI